MSGDITRGNSSGAAKVEQKSIATTFRLAERATIHHGTCNDLLKQIPSREIQVVITSPPYNMGKKYGKNVEDKFSVDEYISSQHDVIRSCADRLAASGSLCWQVGNHVVANEVFPIDIMLYPVFREVGLVLRNRIVWHFEHGFHGYRRLSGRHETILWFTWPGNDYKFNLDPIRVPQKYPGKRYYKGPRAGEFSANPKGKNPGDVWIIPNVKHNHIEKTSHPCQFPVELAERLVLALSDPDDLVVDPYLGVGSTAVAAVRHGRRVAGSEIVKDYVDLSHQRVNEEFEGRLKTRPMNRPVYSPHGQITVPPWDSSQLPLGEAGGIKL